MRRRWLLVPVAALALAGAMHFIPDALRDRSLPSERRAGTIFDRENAVARGNAADARYGTRRPYDCVRDGRDGAFVDLDDVDFVCTPRLKNGEACELGACVGFGVDFDGDRVAAYKPFGGG